jgi:hypothetical protein
MVRRSKLKNVGNEDEARVSAETEANAEETMAETPDAGETEQASEQSSPAGEEVTQESEADQADLENAGVNVDEASDERRLRRERNTLLRDVAKIGEAYGAGLTSMISLAERVTEAAMHKAIGPKDAEDIYNRFREKADAKATMDDAGLVPDAATMEKAPKADPEKSRAQQLSKLRTFIKLGNTFDEDAADIVRRARNIHLELIAGDRSTVKVGSTYTILVGVASEQMSKARAGQPMTNDDLYAWMSVEAREPQLKDGAGKILDALVSALAARKGGADRAPVTSESLDAAIDCLRAALGEVAPERLQAYDDKVAATEKAKADKAEAKKKAA